jgi:7-cyano-7-deazaguanine synthase in queuosine biosynthesis
MQATIVARQEGCQRIVWPIQVGPDPERMGIYVEITASLTEIADLEGGAAGSISIDLPLLDLDDRQVVDLSDDCGASMDGFWPCEAGGSEPCGECPTCRRWRHAFESAAVPWPWMAATVS